MDKVKEIWGKTWGTVKTKWTDIGKKGHIIFFSVLGVVVASAVVLAILLNNPGYAVLYSGASSEETAEIITVIRSDLGTTDVTINSNGDILVPEKDVENLRVQLSMLGYPKSAFNYNIWDSGVGIFSTESDKRVKEKQQLQENLRATLSMYEGVDSAIVILGIPDTNDYVISNSRDEASASVVLMLNKELSTNVIKGIYNLVKTAVPGLKEENITVTDGEGKLLTTEEIVQQQSDDDEIELYNKRLDVQNSITTILKDKLVELFDGVFPDFRVGVDVQLNYDSQVTQRTEYTPSVDSEGNRGGMVNNEKYVSAGGGNAAEGGIVGTTVDADISPDYPTLQVGEGDEFYYEWQKEINYLVNEEIRQIEKDGYSYDNISATVVVDATGVSQAETEEWQSAIANAIGADMSRVTFKAYPFTLDGTDGSAIGGGDGTVVVPGGRDALIFVIIALGIILVVLLVIALFATGSGKKRAKIRRATAAAMGGTPQTSSFGSSTASEDDVNKQHDYDEDEKDNYELQSLTENSEESREAMLKKEIRDFSKTNPEIVAQLIRTWLKSDE